MFLYIVRKVKLKSGVKSIISPGSLRLKEGGGTVEFYVMQRFINRREKRPNCPIFNNLFPFLSAYGRAEIILSSLYNEA